MAGDRPFAAARNGHRFNGGKPEPRTDFRRAEDILRPIDPSTFAGKPIPEPEFLVNGSYFPLSSVTGIGGHSGWGKSQLAVQLACSVARGVDWLGMACRKRNVLLIACEDTEAELHRRLARIAEAEDFSLRDLSDLRVVSMVGREASMVQFDREKWALDTTSFFSHVLNYATDWNAGLVILDSLHDIYTEDEIKRQYVRWFVNRLREIAVETQGAVIVLQHPSQAGLKDKTGESGSTAWRAAYRQFLHLDRPDKDSPVRTLTITKSNYGGDGVAISMTFADGVLVRDGDAPAAPDRSPRMSPRTRRVYELLADTVNTVGRQSPGGVIPHSAIVVTEDEWRQSVYAGTVDAGETPDNRRKAFRRAADSLISMGKVGKHQQYVWVIGQRDSGTKVNDDLLDPLN